jgi:exodeoxyribonuclease-3
MPIKILHWNINGIRAIMHKKVFKGQPFEASILKQNADIIVFTETKISDDARADHGPVGLLFDSYQYQYHAHATKKGYSGVSVYSKVRPVKQLTIDNDEGRLVILEYSTFILIAMYVPNSGAKLNRLAYRTQEWDKQFMRTCERLIKRKPLVIVGDLNVAHMDLDISHPEKHHDTAGFTDIERGNFDKLLRRCDLLDTWRVLHDGQTAYTYFDYRTKARQRNAGWRIDYVLISSKLQQQLLSSSILDQWTGSDHLPIVCILGI